MPFVRRTFLATTAATLGAGNSQAAVGPRKRIAFLATEMRVLSHAQQFLDRLAMGYAWRGCWQPPRIDVASVYMDQRPKDDLAKERIAR